MKNQRGMVSLTVSVIVSILLSLIVIAAVVIIVGETRQAVDSDQAVRAYYAAESGSEHGILKVLNVIGGPLGDPNSALTGLDECPVAPSFGPDYGYTCLKISRQEQRLEGRLNQDKVNQLNLIGNSFSSMVVRWNLQGENPAAFAGGYPTGSGPTHGQFVSGINWAFPAVMEIEIVALNKLTNTVHNTRYVEVTPGTATTALVPGISGSGEQEGRCVASATYNCIALINGFDTVSYDYIVRLLPRYASTDYKIQFDQKFSLATAQVDSTGRAGDVYRRAVYTLKYTAGPFLQAAPFQYTDFTDPNICATLDANPKDPAAGPVGDKSNGGGYPAHSGTSC